MTAINDRLRKQRLATKEDLAREDLRQRRISRICDIAKPHMRNGIEDIGILNLPSLNQYKREDVEDAIKLVTVELREERFKK